MPLLKRGHSQASAQRFRIQPKGIKVGKSLLKHITFLLTTFWKSCRYSLPYFYNERKAKVGVEIVPCHQLKQQMSTGVAYGEQLVYELSV